MDRPSVTVHNTVSADGRLTGFPVDLGLHYEIAATFGHDAVLTGSDTLLAAAKAQGIDLTGDDGDEPEQPTVQSDRRPWLVIVDSRGRLPRLAWLRRQPFWRDVLVLCSETTPGIHLARLRRHRVEHLVVGADRVDLPAALRLLAERYGIRTVRVDAGGALNGALMRAALVDELSLILAPRLAGDAATVPLCAGSGPDARLEFVAVQRLPGGHLWLRYRVRPMPCGRPLCPSWPS